MNSKPISSYINSFLKYLKSQKGRSEKTILNYNFYLNRFIQWFGNKGPEQITEQKIKQYQNWLNKLIDVHGEPLKANTQNYHLIALRSFLKYLCKKEIKTILANQVPLQPMPKRNIVVLNNSDIDSLMEAPIKKQTPGLISSRDKAILELLLACGLRVSELSKLQKKDVDLKKNEIIISCKSKKRAIELSSQASYWIKKYLDMRNDTSQHLFISHDKRTGEQKNTQRKAITHRSIQRMVQKYAKLAGIMQPVTPHTLRHSKTTALVNSGAAAEEIKDFLGHSSNMAADFYKKLVFSQHKIRKKNKN